MDKRISPGQLRLLRIDVVSGAVLTGVISFFVVVACATTLHREGIRIDESSAAARALEPLAGQLAAELLAVGLVGAALLSASVLPVSTARSVCDVAGRPNALFGTVREAPLFYGTFGVATAVRVALVLHILTARAILRDPPNANLPTSCEPPAAPVQPPRRAPFRPCTEEEARQCPNQWAALTGSRRGCGCSCSRHTLAVPAQAVPPPSTLSAGPVT